MSYPRVTSLNEEDKKIAQSQVFFYERYAAAYYQTEIDAAKKYPAVVCIPPRSTGGMKQWIAIDPLTNEVSPTPIKQPDQDRTVLCNDNSYCTVYYYYDQLPCCIGLTIIGAILCSIFTTPLILLCCIPMLYKMFRVSVDVVNCLHILLRHAIVPCLLDICLM